MGLILPRKAEQQAADTREIDRSELQPGDLASSYSCAAPSADAGIYIGDGTLHPIHPNLAHRYGWRTWAFPDWSHRFDGARRVTAAEAANAAVSGAAWPAAELR